MAVDLQGIYSYICTPVCSCVISRDIEPPLYPESMYVMLDCKWTRCMELTVWKKKVKILKRKELCFMAVTYKSVLHSFCNGPNIVP